ncbi:ATP-binding protein [Sphingomonas arantia]|uniref:ATP-binding protein n=1 Tax=Sphingomonas arantia TaxID=1460676 RepID=A0ABW4U2T8_9SPHN
MIPDTQRPQADFSFGSFDVFLPERRIEREGLAVKIGARAFDILSVLLDHAGNTVSKQEVADHVWPGITVGETSLRFQIVGLRKLLAEGDDDRVIATVPGRGYCFVTPVTRHLPTPSVPFPNPDDRPSRLPGRLSHMLGREKEVTGLCAMLKEHRFVTVLGTGGIGKTTVAVAGAHALSDWFARDICFVDLGSVTDPRRVASTMSASLGFAVNDGDAVATLGTFLKQRRILVVLDSCEHVIAATAVLAERLFQAAPQLHIIATSREALRVEGEHVFVLAPFACPDDDDAISVERLLEFPSARLLLDRAAAAGTPIKLGPGDAGIVSDICRRLDGIALAIELAASRIPAYGLRGTLNLLNDRFRHLQGGRRTAIPRHRTLADTLAWSYDLLDERSRLILQRLALFIGPFGLEAASVVSDDSLDEVEAIEIIENLVAKSLIAICRTVDSVRYRLLDTTKAYLVDRFAVSRDADAVRRRHAELFRDLAAGPVGNDIPQELEAERVPNLRIALDWAFGPGGDTALGVTVAAAAAPLFLRMSLLTECRDVTLRAIAALDDAGSGSLFEMELQTCLGQSLMFTSGNTDDVEQAFQRALVLAERYGDLIRQFRLLGALHIFYERTADFGKALSLAQRGFDLAERIGNPAGIAAAHSLLGIAWHLLGRHREADLHLAPAMKQLEDQHGIDPIGFGFDHRNRACITAARSLWLQGFPDAGASLARDTVEASAALSHPVTHCIALIWAVSIAEWREDWTAMDGFVERFSAHADRHSLRPYLAVSACMRGQLAIRAGDIESGISMIQANLVSLRAARYEMLTTGFMTTLAEGLAQTGKVDEALEIITQCEDAVERNGDRLHTPEVMRVRASILALMGEVAKSREVLEQSLVCAQAQSATAWELKSACDLVERGDRNAFTLQPILTRYGPSNSDATRLRAQRLLENLG